MQENQWLVIRSEDKVILFKGSRKAAKQFYYKHLPTDTLDLFLLPFEIGLENKEQLVWDYL